MSERRDPDPRDSDHPARARGADSVPAMPPGAADVATPAEIGGRAGPDPVRYGDWEKNGRCIDF